MKSTILIIASIFGLGNLYGQKDIVSTGQSISNNYGSTTYTAGQISGYQTEDSDGISNSGIQQPFEILSLVVESNEFNFGVKVFPNPTHELINVQLIEITDSCRAFLIDSHGKVVKQLLLNQETTEINVSFLRSGNYFIRVDNGTNSINTHKIIKY